MTLLRGGLLVAGLGMGALHWVWPTSVPPRGAAKVTAEEPALAQANVEVNGDSLQEVQRLRAELRKKDELLATLAARAQTADTPAPVIVEPPAKPLDPRDHAADVLDERMMSTIRRQFNPSLDSLLSRSHGSPSPADLLGTGARHAEAFCQ